MPAKSQPTADFDREHPGTLHQPDAAGQSENRPPEIQPSDTQPGDGGGASTGRSDAAGLASQELIDAATVIRGPADTPVGDAAAGASSTPASVTKGLLGQRLNHFRIDQLIGGGGMGAVFRAHDERLDRTVAIKVIPFVGDDPDLQRRFRNESQSAAKLDHQHIAKVFDTGRHQQWHYIVFEYVQGINIRDWVHGNGVLPIDDAVLYTCHIADALGHAAQRGITHRDVKPSNVLIAVQRETEQKQIKLVDMGLARSENLDLSDDMTASGVTLGTFDYISPEQAHDPRRADLRSDIYSLGCTLYFMLTGSPPYPGGTMLQKLLSHGNQPPPDPRTLRGEVSENLVAVIHKMLAKEPAQRYQAANHLIADLREVAVRDNLIAAKSVVPVRLGDDRPLVGTAEKHLPWVVAVMLLISVALWLRLESAATRQTLAIPDTAKTPVPIQFPQSPVGFAQGRDLASPLGSPLPPGIALPAADSPRSVLPLSKELSSRMASSRGGVVSPGGGMTAVPPDLSSTQVVDLRSDSAQIDPGQTVAVQNDVMHREPTVPLRPDLIAWQQAQPIIDSAERSLRDQAAGGRLLGSPSFRPSAIRVVAAPTPEGVRLGVDQELYCASLIRGIELAQYYGMGVVEIASPKIYSPPISIDAENLRVQSSVGQSTVVFKTDNVSALQRPSMCVLKRGSIAFKNLHFVWDVPEAKVDGGSMFQIAASTEFWLSHCTVTIHNAAQRTGVYAIDVATQRSPVGLGLAQDFASDLRSDPAELSPRSFGQSGRKQDDFPMVAVDLDNVIVRGQASMVHLEHAAKLLLRWKNGLLAISGHMVDTAGARVPMDTSDSPMILALTRVTAHAASGIARVRMGASGSYPFVIHRNARNCVFIVDDSQPHFDFVNYPAENDVVAVGNARNLFLAIDDSIVSDYGSRVSTFDFSRYPLHLGGSSNTYQDDQSGSDTLLRMTLSDGELKTFQTDALVAGDLEWIDEISPRWAVQWPSGQSPLVSMSSRRPDDYRQSQSPGPGFEEDSLPLLPAVMEF